MLPQIAYALCAIASLLCFVLLVRSYLQTRVGLLMWSGTAFFFFAAQNTLLFIDLVLVPGTSFLWWRTLAGFTGAAILLFGLIWEK